MRAPVVAALAALVVAVVVRLPGLGAGGLDPAEQAAFVESRGFSTTAALPEGRLISAGALPRHAGLLGIARGATVPPLYAVLLASWTRPAGASEGALRLPSAVTGVLAAVLAALVAGRLAGPRAAAWAGGLVALSPIHALASRQAGPEAPLVFVLALSLALLARVEGSGTRPSAIALGLALALLTASGVAAFAALAVLALVWLARRADRRPAASLAFAALLAGLAGAALLGLARSPLDFGQVPSWMPETTGESVVRCAGASFMRVAGIEYHVAVPQARHALPLTALFVGLMARGAARLPARARGLLAAGAALPFLAGGALSLAVGHVAPLQAARLLGALPFVALLLAVGLASLRGWRAWSAGATVGGTVLAFLALALAGPRHAASPPQALALEVARCRGSVVAVLRPLDLLTLAAWDAPGPFVLRTPGAPAPPGPSVVVGRSSACVGGGAACGALPRCPSD